MANKQSGLGIYLRLLSYIKPYLWAFILSVFGFLIYAGTQTAAAKWLEVFVDAIENGQYEYRGYLAGGILLVFLVRGIGAFLGNYGLTYVARYVVHFLRRDLFNRLLVLPSSFYHQNSSSDLLARLTYNVEQVTGAATNALKIAIREGLTVVGLFGYMLYLNWKLTLLFVVIGPVVGAVVGYASKRMRRISKNVQGSVGDITASAAEAIKGYQVVRIFGGTESEKKRFEKASQRNRQQFMKMVVTQSVTTPIVQMLVAGVIAILTFLAMEPSLVEQMSTGQFIAFISAASLMAKPIRQLTEINATVQKGLAAAHSLFEVIDTDAEKDTGQHSVERIDGRITFKGLGFRYEESARDILQNINLDIQPGETIALVGKSGSGKTTLANLLPRFYDQTSGELLIDNVAIGDIPLMDLRRQIALVNQQVVLFEGTIAQNIAYGSLAEHSEEAVLAAAEAAHVLEFARNLPDGLDTMIGENGMLLSGGQRQRIAIARAILKDAPILILDEATSALDTQSERHIQDALENVMRGRTTLVIAHRLSTIETADRILVMDAGQVIEQGSHRELLAQAGVYAKLHSMQFSEQQQTVAQDSHSDQFTQGENS
ncbi:lipid A export permease/ATP-binding protein MsbA [Aliamphritea spongicola]|uniref:lipid A export permease/ATP-binding protein MsbA n=1 Tax=Aliamphritea spongicola TaxID=707589 RepID=UPI001A9C462F|nr:lipid A export permease/ATP-binding protein MsbA [Aliamphritea spongicola]